MPKTRARRASAPPPREPGISGKVWLGLIVGGGLVAAIALGWPWIPRLANAVVTAIATTFGLGIALIAAALLACGAAAVFGLPGDKRTAARVSGGLLLLAVAAFIALGLARPRMDIAGAMLDVSTAGGTFGAWLAGAQFWPGVARAVGAVGFALVVLFPGAARGLGLAIARRAATGARALPGFARSLVLLSAPPDEAPVRVDRVTARPAPAPMPSEARFVADDSLAPTAPTAQEAPTSPKAQPAKPNAMMALLKRAIEGAATLPPIGLLEELRGVDATTVDVTGRVRQIEIKLAEYGVDAKVVEVNRGPSITQFGIEPGWDIKYREVRERDTDGRVKLDKDGSPKTHQEEVSRVRVKVGRILALSNDLSLALAVPSVRIEAPVPGKPYIGIEVPNVSTSVVSLRKVIESPGFQKAGAKSRLVLALGQDVGGNAIAADLARMPHCLVAGATGSGKSVCINAMVASILMHATPEDVRLLMVDPKRVEMSGYNDIPHLLAPVVADAPKVIGVLRWVLRQMEERYKQYQDAKVRNIEAWNAKAKTVGEPRMPYLVVVIDELADLMMVASEEVEKTIVRLAQLGRACGIHLIIATQRPSVDVVTGLIKANIPTRIAFAVTSSIDSRTILDQVGAEKLLGRGDMLYSAPDSPKPVRLQGVYVSDAEIDKIVDWWKASRPPQYIEELVNMPDVPLEDGDADPMYEEAKRLAEESGRLSTSFLQRRLRIGYNRAARLMDTLEEEGLIEPPDSRRAVAAGMLD